MRVAVVVVAAPGADAGPALGALATAGVTDAVVVELLAPGAWAAARNAAIERAGEADVLALVDHDVRVGPGWGAAVARAFEADPLAGAAGGPLRAAAAPAWLVGDHAEVLALHDGEDRPGPFPGGNVAFRLAALRGVGGFFPARGHVAARDTVGEDRWAQSELLDAGWHLVAVPGMAADRDLSTLRRADLLRRRLHTGARAATLTGATARGGLALAARSGAAAAARALRGDRAGALDRAAWAAHGAGAVLGPALAHGGLQPDRTTTPLRADVAPAAPHPLARARPGSRRRREDGARGGDAVRGAVLLYHRVVDLPADPLGLAVSPAHFAEQLDALRARWEPARLEQVAAGEAGPHAVAITFDDGYHDNLLHALPALRAADVPATLFASTGHVETGEGYWWDVVTALVGEDDGHDDRAAVLALDLPEGPRAWAPGTDPERRAVVRAHVHAALRTRDRATIAAALGALRRWAGEEPAGSPPPERDRPLTVAELRELAAAGPFAVQAHGRTHLSLAHAPAASRDRELRGSADDLERWLGTRPTVFSYPFGVPGVDVDAATAAAARAAGYRSGTVNAPGLVRASGDPSLLPRLAVPDVGGAEFARWLDAVLPGR